MMQSPVHPPQRVSLSYGRQIVFHTVVFILIMWPFEGNPQGSIPTRTLPALVTSLSVSVNAPIDKKGDGWVTWKTTGLPWNRVIATMPEDRSPSCALVVGEQRDRPIFVLGSDAGRGYYRLVRISGESLISYPLKAWASKENGIIDHILTRSADGGDALFLDTDGDAQPDLFATSLKWPLWAVLTRDRKMDEFTALFVYDLTLGIYLVGANFGTTPDSVSVLFIRSPSGDWIEHIREHGDKGASAVILRDRTLLGIHGLLVDKDGDQLLDFLMRPGEKVRKNKIDPLARGADLRGLGSARIAGTIAEAGTLAAERWRESWPRTQSWQVLGYQLPRVFSLSSATGKRAK